MKWTNVGRTLVNWNKQKPQKTEDVRLNDFNEPQQESAAKFYLHSHTTSSPSCEGRASPSFNSLSCLWCSGVPLMRVYCFWIPTADWSDVGCWQSHTHNLHPPRVCRHNVGIRECVGLIADHPRRSKPSACRSIFISVLSANRKKRKGGFARYRSARNISVEENVSMEVIIVTTYHTHFTLRNRCYANKERGISRRCALELNRCFGSIHVFGFDETKTSGRSSSVSELMYCSPDVCGGG